MGTKTWEWLRRYLPPEITGTVTAILFATIASLFTSNTIIVAFMGTWGENLGFYITIITRDLLKSFQRHKHHTLGTHSLLVIRTIRNLLVEFGPAEILDSFFIRPFMMYFFARSIDHIQVGILIGKLAADSIFYLLTIIDYELRKKFLPK